MFKRNVHLISGLGGNRSIREHALFMTGGWRNVVYKFKICADKLEMRVEFNFCEKR